jgi:hypothetical protein
MPCGKPVGDTFGESAGPRLEYRKDVGRELVLLVRGGNLAVFGSHEGRRHSAYVSRDRL